MDAAKQYRRRVVICHHTTNSYAGGISMGETTADTEQLVTEYVQAWNKRDFSQMSKLVAESFTFTSPTAGTIEGRENVEAYAKMVVDGFSDFEVEVQEMLAGDELVMTESILSGTHDGEFNDISPTHETFEIRDMAKFVIEDGTLQQERLYFDQHEFLSQLGLLGE